ncbi:MAG: class I SAM-dependent methyltransferase [Burkholderiaceae bacterium]|jgi:cyclopropane-fatty-acyl-phospholipid synthase
MSSPGLTARMVLNMLRNIQIGEIRLITPAGEHQLQGLQQADLAPQTFEIRRWRAFERALRRGDIGFGESFMDGDWTTPDLPGLLRTLAANRQALDKAIVGHRWLLLLDRIGHLLRSNSTKRAKKNIEAHYDLGNDFYRLWLDPTMTYSSAIYTDREMRGELPTDLSGAQNRKMDRALSMLGPLGPESQTLEIGCGWGGLAMRRLQQPGRHVGITLSVEQKAWAEEHLAAEGLQDRCEIRLQDYRHTDGRFDGIVSIEMIEAVGEAYWPTYFNTLHRCLKPGGRAVVQAIVIRDDLFPRYRKGLDFIQKYIFPGGMLLSRQAIESVSAKANLRVVDEYAFGQHYARTLRDWYDRFNAKEDEIRALGFDDRFMAMWRFYLSYCEAGFYTGDLDVLQVCFER